VEETNTNTIAWSECILQQTIDNQTAIPHWSELDVIPAAATYGELYEPIAAGSPFVWYDALADRALLDDRYLTDFTTVDVTNIYLAEEPIPLTTVASDIFSIVTPRELVMLLIETHLIQTYAHLNADICLTAEEDTPAGDYSVHFSAVHRYCTNDCYEEDYTFTVTIDATGQISVGL